MSILVLLALVVGFVLCALPGLMAWRYNFGGAKRSAEKKQLSIRGELHPAQSLSK
jgi:hypothetical protein